MVTLTPEIIKIDGEEYASIRLPTDIHCSINGLGRGRNTLLFKPEFSQHLSGTIQFEAWLIDDIRDEIRRRNQSLTEQEVMGAYLGELHHGTLLDGRSCDFEACELVYRLIINTGDGSFSENLSSFGLALCNVILDLYGNGIKEYDVNDVSDDERIFVHRIKTKDKTYVRINTYSNPLRLSAARNNNRPAFYIAGIERLNNMFLDISQSPEELFKIGAYAIPPLLRQSKILREWRIGRDLDIVEDFRQLPY